MEFNLETDPTDGWTGSRVNQPEGRAKHATAEPQRCKAWQSRNQKQEPQINRRDAMKRREKQWALKILPKMKSLEKLHCEERGGTQRF